MKIDILQEIIEKKISKKRFAVLTNLMNGKSELFELGNHLSDDFKVHKKDIEMLTLDMLDNQSLVYSSTWGYGVENIEKYTSSYKNSI